MTVEETKVESAAVIETSGQPAETVEEKVASEKANEEVKSIEKEETKKE